MSNMPRVKEVYIIPAGGQVDDIKAADLDIRVTVFQNGFKAVAEIPKPPPDYVAPEMTLSELVAMSKEGLDVPAREVLPLVLRHRRFLTNMHYISNHIGTDKFGQGLADWLYRTRKYMEDEVVL